MEDEQIRSLTDLVQKLVVRTAADDRQMSDTNKELEAIAELKRGDGREQSSAHEA